MLTISSVLRSHKLNMELQSKNTCKLSLLIFQLVYLSYSLAGGNETDRLSLLAFKDQITYDPLGLLSSWNDSLHFCEWSGVTCGRRHQRVVELDLHSRQLLGSLSPHIGNLSFLRILDLENNSLSSYIPQELGRLSRLQELDLWINKFSGEIPANISRCSNLSRLVLGRNNLTGKLPSELGSLSKLQLFVFESNNLVGEIPTSFQNLSSIEAIFGMKNNLQGGILKDIEQWKNLRIFSLGTNNLSGIVPPSMYNLSSLTHLSIPLNNFHGILPTDLCLTLPNLIYLDVHTNQFGGQIPQTLSNASNFIHIQLANNLFTGKVPYLASMPNLTRLIVGFNYLGDGEDDDLNFLNALANNTSLEELCINDNMFGGLLPQILSNFSTTLKRIAFGGNQIRGSIPTDIGNVISLGTLGLEENQLIGIIPSSIGKLQNLRILNLSQNKMFSKIPYSLGNVTSLLRVNLSGNNLEGSIPSSLGNCRNLLSLGLSQNNLSGSIPKEVVGISSLSSNLDLSGNQLTGSLPSEVDRLVNLGYLDVSENRLSGEIPASLGSCISLETLYLQGNYFQGYIPDSLSSLKGITKLNLSHNNLTGQIPKFLAEFKLSTELDLSFNDLEGEVPMEGVFQNASAISISGNKKVCGGIPQLNLSTCTLNKSLNPKYSIKRRLIISVACAISGIVLVAAFVVFFYLKKTNHKPAPESSLETLFPRVAYEDLLQATNGFSSANLIGAGSFGSVYKGILNSNGVVVAVKVFNLLQQGASRSFMAECSALMNIRHRNLVKVLTACSSIDFQGNDFKAVVFELMVNGSLEEWLHPAPISYEAHGQRKLSLTQRLNIAIDVANVLEYLHHHCEMPLVHCDLKPSNVLLDADMTAHVGDFGLARFLLQTSSQNSSNQTSSVGLKGTVGYAAPEYGMGSEVSTYGDVYSYGILLLEMFTGRRPTDSMFEHGLNLHSFAQMALPVLMEEIVDPLLLREAEEASAETADKRNNIGMEKILECLISIIKVGVACSVEVPRERMEISNVTSELRRTNNIVFGTQGSRRREIIVAPAGAQQI